MDESDIAASGTLIWPNAFLEKLQQQQGALSPLFLAGEIESKDSGLAFTQAL